MRQTEKIIAAEPDHTGYTGRGDEIPMSNPGAAAIAPLLAAFNAARTPHEQTLTATDTEREELQALYPEAQALAVDICETVEFYYRGDKIPSRFRVKCRRWGVAYIYGANELPDPSASSSSSSSSSSSESSAASA